MTNSSPDDIRFYRGIKEIANFLDVSERTVYNLIKTGKLPVKREPSGKWVLSHLDYMQCLVIFSPEDAI